ncbi:hypothetical protein FHX52_0569 [Humibacillus xanthopallidus]|uniref:Uncharacterized protein n=1 Tax=Humibacillus xanthopallidus TaxID=412689 RepID=A0A543PTQ4_9MICO|nr:hypothetical protein [Humibacillus xanthopallidus]TQN47467.1 hypothetical protein FHX52_0569 [Humibacillus xanthopallidus]
MNTTDDRSAAFAASPAQAVAALEEAARRTGMQHLSADHATGIYVFTAGRLVLATGEKVTAIVREVAPGVVQVTLSSDLQFGLTFGGPDGAARDRMFDALVPLLPPAQP